eukprot:5593509-Pyramimonas_sp.AAC.1
MERPFTCHAVGYLSLGRMSLRGTNKRMERPFTCHAKKITLSSRASGQCHHDGQLGSPGNPVTIKSGGDPNLFPL